MLKQPTNPKKTSRCCNNPQILRKQAGVKTTHKPLENKQVLKQPTNPKKTSRCYNNPQILRKEASAKTTHKPLEN
jgi:hypothetical protein